MGRTVHFGETDFVLNLRGLTSFFALKRQIVMPYKTIRRVTVDDFDAPKWMLRMPGTSIAPLHVYEGSFKFADEWYFLSYENRENLVIIELEGHEKYRHVIFQMDDSTSIAAEIRKRLRTGE